MIGCRAYCPSFSSPGSLQEASGYSAYTGTLRPITLRHKDRRLRHTAALSSTTLRSGSPSPSTSCSPSASVVYAALFALAWVPRVVNEHYMTN